MLVYSIWTQFHRKHASVVNLTLYRLSQQLIEHVILPDDACSERFLTKLETLLVLMDRISLYNWTNYVHARTTSVSFSAVRSRGNIEAKRGPWLTRWFGISYLFVCLSDDYGRMRWSIIIEFKKSILTLCVGLFNSYPFRNKSHTFQT